MSEFIIQSLCVTVSLQAVGYATYQGFNWIKQHKLVKAQS